MTSRNDKLVAALAGVRDEELAAPGDEARALLAEILLDRTGVEQPPGNHSAPAQRRSSRRRRLVLGGPSPRPPSPW